MRSRETSSMAKSAWDGGQSARFGRAQALWSRGFGCLRLGERDAASMSCSELFGLMCCVLYQDFCRVRKPTKNCCRGSRGAHLILARRATAAHSLVGRTCGMGQETQQNNCGVNNSRSLIKGRCVSSSTSRPGWRTCQDAHICGQPQMRALLGRESRGGSGHGNNELGVLPACQRRRIRRGRAPAAQQRRPRRNRRLRAPALDAGSDRRETRGCNERQSPGCDRELAKSSDSPLRRLTRHPVDTRRTVTSRRLGPASRHDRSRNESALEIYCRGDDQRQGRAPCRRLHSVEAELCCCEGDPSIQTAKVRKARAQGPKTAGQAETVPRPSYYRPSLPPRPWTTPPATPEWVAHVLCINVIFLQRNRVYQLCLRGDRSRHASKRRRIPMPASQRRRA